MLSKRWNGDWETETKLAAFKVLGTIHWPISEARTNRDGEVLS